MEKKKIFVIVLMFMLISISNAKFYITGKSVVIKIDKYGNAYVTEKISLLVEGKSSIAMYISGLEKPTLADWQNIIDSDDIRVHVDRSYARVEELNIRPQPLYNYNPLNEVARGEIIISYKALPYEGKEDSGVFISKRIKPRTYEISLNEKALSFKRSGAGNIIIDDKTRLVIIPPENSVLKDVNPIPDELREVNLPVRVEKVEWKNVLLVNPSLVFEYKESIGEEIYGFFEQELRLAINFVNTNEGKLIIVFVILLLIFYAQITSKLRERRGKR